MAMEAALREREEIYSLIFNQAGDGIELLFEAGGWPALAMQAHGGLPLEQFVERNVEGVGEPGEQVGGNTRAGDLVVPQCLLGDAEGFGERMLGVVRRASGAHLTR